MARRKLYIPAAVRPWQEVRITPPGQKQSLDINTRQFTSAHHSAGFVPVYLNIESLREDFPGVKVLVMEGDWSVSEDITPTDRMTFEPRSEEPNG